MADKDLKAGLDAEIERWALRNLANMAQEFYKNPANRQAYQEWLRSKDSKPYLEHINS